MLYYNAAYDDCLRCCVAGLLNKSLVDIPDFNTFLAGNESWFPLFARFMKEKHWVQCEVLRPEEVSEEYTLGIMQGYREGSSHAVVIKKGTADGIEHDPNPEHPLYKGLVAKVRFKKLPRKLDMSDHFAEPTGAIDLEGLKDAPLQ